jgi:high affinity sulfate transporter 1
MREINGIRTWLPGYRREWLRADILSGANVWAVLVPSALAYASLVGVPPIYGLYCIPGALLAYALLGGSKLLVVGPDATIAVFAGSAIATVGLVGQEPMVAVVLSLIVGLILVLLYVLRLGWIADLIPDPALKGMIEGVVWVTIINETIKILGLQLGDGHDSFISTVPALLVALPETHLPSLAVGLGALLILFGCRRYAPRLPAALIMLVGVFAADALYGLDENGVETIGETGDQSMSLGLSTLPSLNLIADLIPGALAIAVIGFTLAIAAAKRAAEKTGERIQPNQELAAIGAANLGSGLLGGFAVTGTLSKTAVAMEAGGKSQVGNLFTAALAILTLLFLTPLLAPIAHAALAALVIFVMLEVSDLRYFQRLWKVRRFEFVTAVLSIAGVLVFGPLAGVLIGALLALVLLAEHISRPPITELVIAPDGEVLPAEEAKGGTRIPGLFIWRQYGPLVFLNARRLSDELRAELAEGHDTKVVLIDGTATSGIDSTGAAEFAKLRDDLAAEGIEIWACGFRLPIRERIDASHEAKSLPVPRHFETIVSAIDHFKQAGTSAET